MIYMRRLAAAPSSIGGKRALHLIGFITKIDAGAERDGWGCDASRPSGEMTALIPTTGGRCTGCTVHHGLSQCTVNHDVSQCTVHRGVSRCTVHHGLS